MDKLSKDSLEKLATDKRLSIREIQEYIDRELKQVAEDIVKRLKK